MKLTYPVSPLACLELVVRSRDGDRLSLRPGTTRSPGVVGSFRTELPPGQLMRLLIDPMAEVAEDAIRAGEYTAQAVYRQAEWQAASEPVPFRVAAADWRSRAQGV